MFPLILRDIVDIELIREITQFLALERKKKKRKETRFQRSGFETKEI